MRGAADPTVPAWPELRLDAFMARANAAYYANHDPFRDFTTAPEIAQMFGELLGLWAAVTWRQIGAPARTLLVEAGPGRGTLMADALRAAARAAPDFVAACQVHFIETSPRLRAAQKKLVPRATWHAALENLPPGPAIVLANEFLDALPIRQFERRGGAWAERHVNGGQFVLHAADRDVGAAPDGTVIERHDAACNWAACLARRLAAEGGAALILDYGTSTSLPGDTLQALRHGRPADPLAAPGEADLTALVDFQAVAQAATAAGAAAWGPLPQGTFLNRLGLAARTRHLAAANPGREAALRDAAARLSAPERMGELFKALAITQPGHAAPPGFEA
jgi:SAM-dependent MidA family methyltransferase